MKVFFDNNMPPLLAKALAILSEQDGNEVVHLKERFPDRDNIGDQEWLQDLLDTDERWVIISTDYNMHYFAQAKEALRRKFTFFYLTGAWRDAPSWTKTVQCVRMWKNMLEFAEKEPGEYKLPITGTKIISIEKNKARKKRRKRK